MRLDKFVAQAAQITRSEARKGIRAGAVTVEGTVCTRAETDVAETAAVTWEGRPLAYAGRYVYLMLDKPKGVVSASEDGRDVTVVDLVRDAYPRRQLFPAGRLDKTSTGFVLLTDDGAFAHDILAPRRHVPKTYQVELDTPLTAEMVEGFANGVTLADGQTMLPAQVLPGENGPCSAVVVLHQGVYHQIKRMFGVYGAGVRELRRVAIGQLWLDERLGPGGWRELTAEEVEKITAGRLQTFQKTNTTAR
ncbi:pseudouridine synthase [Ruthenibacterium sp. CLA-JM-H11]|uniref:Pseudouridine synthase n=1 Tax=Ruthenibacterium intestinale TaxID=3133163 RepID=A0ABV1GBW3_9FIRM